MNFLIICDENLFLLLLDFFKVDILDVVIVMVILGVKLKLFLVLYLCSWCKVFIISLVMGR